MDTQNLTTIPDEIQERWLPIPGFPGYEVSNQGRVRSFLRRIGRKGGGIEWILDSQPQKILKPRLNRGGYLYVILMRDGKQYTHRVHRLTLLTFIGPCPPGHEGCHADGTHINNYLNNLRWDTRSKNHLDKRKHGTSHAGEKHPNVKLTEFQVVRIKELCNQGTCSQKEIGKMFNVSHGHISRIKLRKTWTHLT